ncbi:DUF1445 domain-containing protein [Jeotgalibacillus sp. S-D1]|uniref:D-glutamate cyclase family protein n=1 Tax=Jeotgalibacillus sp. S-D1 TaxID=2552189 RepID=UPI001F10E70F|nr:DUF1445 domain-containing protein [Jeotgalibacillus sp. S-D1]
MSWEDHVSKWKAWRGKNFSFLIGCSFTFEEELIKNGIPIRHYGKLQFGNQKIPPSLQGL